MRRIVVLAALVAAFVFLAPVIAAHAHDWYVGKRDPVTGGSCCTTSATATYGDCAQLAVDPGVLSGDVDGYRLRLTEEQARRINPLRQGPVDTVIPWDRVQASHDGNFHLCIPSREAPNMAADFYCFWAPPNS